MLRVLVRKHGDANGVDGWITIADELNGMTGSVGVERTWKSCHQRCARVGAWGCLERGGVVSVAEATEGG